VESLHVIADDLTGACDVAAALLPWPGGIAVYPDGAGQSAGVAGAPAALAVRNTQSRTLLPADAARRVQTALAPRGGEAPGILLKKIDTGLRGPLGAEIDAALDALGARRAYVLPAIPEVGRTTVGGEQRIDGVPVQRTAFAADPHNPVRDARVAAVIETTSHRPATSIALDIVRRPDGLRAALASSSASIVVLDAETDADLSGAVRVLLAEPAPLVLVGSIGLARALRAALRPDEAGGGVAPSHAASRAGALAVLGSVHPVARIQREHAVRVGALAEVIEVFPGCEEAAARQAAGSIAAGRAVALAAPDRLVAGAEARMADALRAGVAAVLATTMPAGLVLVGGETAFRVLAGFGHPPLIVESRPAPLAVHCRIAAGSQAGLPVITKGGSSGAPDLLAVLLARVGGSGA